MSVEDRAAWLRTRRPQLVADVTLLSTQQGGRRLTILPGWGCPCMVNLEDRIAYDAWPLLGDTPFAPGETRRLGFVFSYDKGPGVMRAARTFYLWEGRHIGTATVVDDTALAETFESEPIT